MNFSSARISKLESALEKNWVVQVILAGIGTAVIFDAGNLPKLIAARYFGGEDSLQTVAAVLLPVFLYYSMKLGHLVTSFNEARELHDKVLKEYLAGQFDEREAEPLRRTTSFLAESFYPGRSLKLLLPYFLVTSLVVSTAQAASLFLVVRAFPHDPLARTGLVVSGLFLLVIYSLFWRSQKDRLRASLAVLFVFVFTTAWLWVFAHRGNIPGVTTVRDLDFW